MECPSCRKAFELSGVDAARATVVCPHCGRVVVVGEGRAAASSDPGTAPLLEPLPARESPTQIGVASQTLSLPAGKRVSVAIVSGPRKGQAVTLVKPTLGFGRAGAGQGMDVEIADPEVSGRHAMLECHGARIVLRDLGSRAGTFVGPERVEGPREVEGGAEFRIGATTLVLLVNDP